MSLASLVHRKDVSIPQEPGADPIILSLRGLSLTDVRNLMNEGGATLANAYVQFTNGTATDETVPAILAKVLTETPDLIARTIATAAGEPDEWRSVRDAPMGTQLDLLMAIGELTFESDAAVKKLSAVVRGFATTAAQTSPTASANGAGQFEAK